MLWECIPGGKPTEAVTGWEGGMRVWRGPGHREEKGRADPVGRDPGVS